MFCARTGNWSKLFETQDKTAQSPLCRMCDRKSETISHIASECEKLAQKECKRRHANVTRIVNWKLRGKSNLKRSEK